MEILLSMKRIFGDIYIWVTAILVSMLAFGNSLTNLIRYKGADQLELINPVDLVLCSSYSSMWGIWMITLFPILVPLAAAMLYPDDKNSGIVFYSASRKGYFTYGLSNFWAIGISTSLAFILPMLLDSIIMFAAFSGFNSGMGLSSSIYDITSIDYMEQYWLYELYYTNSFLYILVPILMISIFAGVLAQFTYAITTYISISVKVFYLIPVFVILEVCGLCSKLVPMKYIDLSYFNLFQAPELCGRSIYSICGFCLLIFLISFLMVCRRFKGDCLA